MARLYVNRSMDVQGGDANARSLGPQFQVELGLTAEEQGGLPDYIERIAVHLKARGMDTSRAVATAVNAAKRMCASGDLNWPGLQQVNPGSRAEACAAVARWEQMKAAARAKKG